MKRILVLGAGKSSPYLVHRLLARAQARDWHVTVADVSPEAARRAIGPGDRSPHGESVALDAGDEAALANVVARADLALCFLAPSFQPAVARACVAGRTHMVSASYEDAVTRSLGVEAIARGVVLLPEMGLDPGIDHMSAMALLQAVRDDGGRIESFYSYGGGVPAPELRDANPFRYAITWNPRNVVMAGAGGAQYLVDGKIRCAPHHEVFRRAWSVEVPEAGTFDAYPNRDALGYRRAFGLDEVATIVRGTLRYPGFCKIWAAMVALGLPDERIEIPRLGTRTYAEVTEMFVPRRVAGATLEARVATHLRVDPRGQEIRALGWLGLFGDEPVVLGPEADPAAGGTAAEMLIGCMGRKLALPARGRDRVVLQHEIVVSGVEGSRRERIVSTMIEDGEPGGFTAMARTVGMPAAIAAERILDGALEAGRRLPTEPAVYRPVLDALGAEGISFTERLCPL